MDKTSEALQKALDCLSQATRAPDEKTRDDLSKMAREWMRLAVELSEQMTFPVGN